MINCNICLKFASKHRRRPGTCLRCHHFKQAHSKLHLDGECKIHSESHTYDECPTLFAGVYVKYTWFYILTTFRNAPDDHKNRKCEIDSIKKKNRKNERKQKHNVSYDDCDDDSVDSKGKAGSSTIIFDASTESDLYVYIINIVIYIRAERISERCEISTPRT